MSIWGNTILGPNMSMGFALNNEKSGVAIEAINPNIFAIPEYQYQITQQNKALKGRAKSTEKEKELEYKGERSTIVFQLTENIKYLERLKDSLEEKYSVLMEEGDEQDILKLKDKYTEEIGKINEELSYNKLNLFKEMNIYDPQIKSIKKTIEEKSLSNSVAIFDNGTPIKSEIDLINNPGFVRLNIEKDDKGNEIVNDFTTYQNVVDNQNNISIGKDNNIPGIEMPVLSISSPKEFHTEVQSLLSSAGMIEYLREMKNNPKTIESWIESKFNGDANNEFNILSETSNIPNLQEMIENMWNKLSDNSRNYILNVTLKTGIYNPLYEKGSDKEDQYIEGKHAVNILQKATEDVYRYRPGGKEYDKDKYNIAVKTRDLFAKAIINTAIANATYIANNQAIGLSRKTYQIEKDENGNNASDYRTAFEALLAKQEDYHMPLFIDDSTGQEPELQSLSETDTGRSITKAFDIDAAQQNILSEYMFKLNNIELSKSDNDIPVKNKTRLAMVNSVFFTPDKLSKNIKVKGIGTFGYILPKMEMPLREDGITTTMQYTSDENGSVMLQPYVTVIVEGTGDDEIPIMDESTKKATWKKLKDIYNNKDKYPNLQLEKNGSDKYNFNMLIEMPSLYSPLNNNPSKLNSKAFKFNKTVANEAMIGDVIREQKREEAIKNEKQNYSNIISSSTNYSFMYMGKQMSYKIYDYNNGRKVKVSYSTQAREVINELRNKRIIPANILSEEDYKKTVAELNKVINIINPGNYDENYRRVLATEINKIIKEEFEKGEKVNIYGKLQENTRGTIK